MTQAKMKKKIFQGRYEILNIVGRGSCSVVYHGKLLEDDKSVALKVLVNKKKTDNLSDRLRQEALSLVSARHKNVIRLDDFHSIGDLSYLAMEYAPHADLASYIKNHEQDILPSEQGLNYIMQIAEALSFVHKIGMLHRDIKPSNILIMDDKLAKLGDFGVALLPGEVTDTKELQNGVGTIDYMAPEVFEGKSYNQSSDIYQLGVTAYEILSGKNPFQDSALVDVLNIRKDSNIKPIDGISNQISHVLQKALSYDLNDRYSEVGNFIDDLNKAIKNELVIESKTTNEPKQEIETSPTPEIIEKKPEVNLEIAKEEAPKITEEAPKPVAPQATKTESDKEKELQKEKEDFFAFMEEMQRKVDQEKKEKAQKQKEANENTNASSTEVNNNQKEDIPFLNTDNNKDIEEPKKKEEQLQATPGSGSSFLEKALGSAEGAGVENDEFNYESNAANSNNDYEIKTDSAVTNNERKPSTSLIKIIIVLAIAYFTYTKFFKGNDVNSNNTYQEVTETSSNNKKILPQNKINKDFSFPNLQSGTYAGEINNLIDGAKHPITLISEGDGKVVSLLVGINGFQPISTTSNLNSDTLVFRTNGFMLEFKAEKLNGFLRGTYTNLINKKSGRWYLKNILNN